MTIGSGGAARTSGNTSSIGTMSAPGGEGTGGNNGGNSYLTSASNGPELFQIGAGSNANGHAGGAGGGAGAPGGPAPGSVCGGTGAAGGAGVVTGFPGPLFASAYAR